MPAMTVLLMMLSVAFMDAAEQEFKPLFPEEGAPVGWDVRAWSDVSKPGPENATWTVKDGVLHGDGARGTWLISQAEYDDFELHFEFKLGPEGNSGCALRAPPSGDPAFDGLELQMADVRYNPEAKDSELTGGLYRALAPTQQVYKPEQWNRYEISLRGSHVKVILNGTTILDTDLAQQTTVVKRHDDTDTLPLKDRPRKGRIGFQNLSRGGSPVLIRAARIRVLAGRGD